MMHGKMKILAKVILSECHIDTTDHPYEHMLGSLDSQVQGRSRTHEYKQDTSRSSWSPVTHE